MYFCSSVPKNFCEFQRLSAREQPAHSVILSIFKNRMTQIYRMTKFYFFIDFHRVSLMFILSFCLKKTPPAGLKLPTLSNGALAQRLRGLSYAHRNKENLSFCHSVQSIGHGTPYPFYPSV